MAEMGNIELECAGDFLRCLIRNERKKEEEEEVNKVIDKPPHQSKWHQHHSRTCWVLILSLDMKMNRGEIE